MSNKFWTWRKGRELLQFDSEKTMKDYRPSEDSWWGKKGPGQLYAFLSPKLTNVDFIKSSDLRKLKSNPELEETFGTLASKGGIPLELKKVYDDYNSGKLPWNKFGLELERIMWKSKTADPKYFSGLQKIIDWWKQKNNRPGQGQLYKLKDEGVGWGDPKKYDKKRAFPGAHWTVKYNEGKTMKKSELRKVIKELVNEMWIGWEQEENKNEELTGRTTEPGSDEELVALYKGDKKGHPDSLPSVGGAMSEATSNWNPQQIPKDKEKVAQLIFSLKEGEYIWFSFDKEGRSGHGYGVQKKVEGDEYIYRTIGPDGEYLEEDEDVERYAQDVVNDQYAHWYAILPIQDYKKAPYEGDPDHDIGDYEMNGPDQPSWRELYESKGNSPKDKLKNLVLESIDEVLKEESEEDEAYQLKKIQSYASMLAHPEKSTILPGQSGGVDFKSFIDNQIRIAKALQGEIDKLVAAHEKSSSLPKQQSLKRRLQYKHGRPVDGMMGEVKKNQDIVINIVDKVKAKK